MEKPNTEKQELTIAELAAVAGGALATSPIWSAVALAVMTSGTIYRGGVHTNFSR